MRQAPPERGAGVQPRWLRASTSSHDETRFQEALREAKVSAKWKGGQMLREIERNISGRPSKKSVHRGPTFQGTVTDVGMSLAMAKRWQTMALVTEKDLEAPQ